MILYKNKRTVYHYAASLILACLLPVFGMSQEEPVVDRIAEQISGIKSGGVKVDVPKVFKDPAVYPTILARIGMKKKELKGVARKIAIDALMPAPGRAQKSKKEQKLKRRVVNADQFTRTLERFLLADTGIAVSIDLNLGAVTDTSNAIIMGTRSPARQVSSNAPISKIRILHVHLPYIHHGQLWDVALDREWKGQKKKQARSLLRPYLSATGVTTGIWPKRSKKYRFTQRVIDDINLEIKKALAGKQPVKDLPPWKEYVKTDPTKVTVGSKSPDIGLRLAKHETNKGRGRESHHLTQYLLVEYFGNRKKDKPFRPGWTYPGLKPTKATNTVKAFEPDVQIDSQIGSKRGPHMPSVLLAATTHRDKRLHITPKGDETTPATQSHALHDIFTDKLGQLADFAAMPSTKGSFRFKKYKKQKGDTTVRQEIYSAMQQTYEWMHAEMAKGLARRLPVLELDYYKALYELIKGPNQEMDNKDQKEMKIELGKIPAQAATYNDKLMRKLGWHKGF